MKDVAGNLYYELGGKLVAIYFFYLASRPCRVKGIIIALLKITCIIERVILRKCLREHV